MGDAADDAYDAAWKNWEEAQEILKQIDDECDAPLEPKPCELVRDEDSAFDGWVCRICNRHFYY